MDDRHVPVYREDEGSLIGWLFVLSLGIAVLTVFVAGLIANWPRLSHASPVLLALVLAVGLGLSVPLILTAIYRLRHIALMDALRAQHAREELEAVKDARRRANEQHTLQAHLAQTRVPADPLGNYPHLLGPTIPSITLLPPGNPAYAPAKSRPSTSVPQIAPPASSAQVVAPTIDSLIAGLPYNRLMTAYGVTVVAGKAISAVIPDAVHFKIVGSSGFGKSCEAAALLKIATSVNDADHVQIALLDLERKTSRLFEDLPHVARFRVGRKVVDMAMSAPSADEVAQKLAVLKGELDRRAARNIETPLLLIYVEEMLSLQYEVDETLLSQMLDHLAILAVRGRKYGMFLEACTQVDYSTEQLRAAQKQFRTRIGFALDPSAARASGFINTALIKENFAKGQPGQFVLEMPGFSELMLAPAYDVKAELARLEAPTSTRHSPTSTTWEVPTSMRPQLRLSDQDGSPDGKRLEAEDDDHLEASESDMLSVKALQVSAMLKQRKGQNEIIEAVWGVTGGRAYQEAVQEYREIVAQLLKRGA